MALRRSRLVGQSIGMDVRSSRLDDTLLASLLPPYRLAKLLRLGVCQRVHNIFYLFVFNSRLEACVL